ncbi:MAG: ABC transporter ATP-binding protein [Actinobacteria bacterium]|nr:MAG: ABC transporter ATP-binding protein [Actinomycetota bacterium]
MFITSLACTATALLLQTAMPRVVMAGIDRALVARRASLTPFVVTLVILALVRAAVSFVSRYFLYRVAFEIEYDLRTIVYEHLTRLSFSFYDRVQSGQLISRANSDIRSVQMYLTFAPSILVQCLSAVFAFVMMLTIDVRLAIVAMITMPFVYLVGVAMRNRMFPISWVVQSRLAEVATIVDENVNGVRVVRSFAAERQQLRQLNRAARRVEWAYVRDVDIRARWAPVVENLPRLGMALILLYGGYLAVNRELTVGAIVAFNTYILLLQAPFRMLGQLMMMGQRASASAQRIYEILDEPPEIVERPGAVDLVDCRGQVDFAGVDFAYAGGPTVLDGFSVQVPPGQTVALVGRTGSGKSTVARLLARFYDVTAGAVRIDGHDVRDLTLASLRARVGVVLDEPFLFSVSIRDNIAFGRPDAALSEVEAAARAAGADEFIRDLPGGYDAVVGERGYTLSGGQRQRIAIARTLLVNPPILVLDDATSAIDVQVEQEIHGALRRLMEGRTTIIVAHRLSTISLADRVLLMEEGRLIADGTHAELLRTEPRYAQVLAQAEEHERQVRAAFEDSEGARAGADSPPQPDELEPIDIAVGGGAA